MNKLSLFLFSLLVGFNSFGQADAIGAFNRFVVHNWAGQYVRIGNYKVKGSPFLLGESFPGKIRLMGSNVSQPAKVLYNLYEQRAGPGTGDEILVTDKLVEEFTLELPEKYGGIQLSFKHCSMYAKPNLKCYFNVLAEGPSVVFLKAYRIRVVADPSNMMDKELKVFEQYYEYFLINYKGTKEVEQVKLKKKDFEKELSSIEGASAIFKSNQFEYATEDDFVKVVKALNNAAK
jgi:hypothetical protein